ncbi:MAG: hypothetical protein K6F08_00125 [bacterium]|nr:hypothetical protein [bacterium]
MENNKLLMEIVEKYENHGEEPRKIIGSLEDKLTDNQKHRLNRVINELNYLSQEKTVYASMNKEQRLELFKEAVTGIIDYEDLTFGWATTDALNVDGNILSPTDSIDKYPQIGAELALFFDYRVTKRLNPETEPNN